MDMPWGRYSQTQESNQPNELSIFNVPPQLHDPLPSTPSQIGELSIPNPIQLAHPQSPKKTHPPICSPFSPSFFSLSLSSSLLLFSLTHLSSPFSSLSKSATSFSHFHFHFHFLFLFSALTPHCLLLPPLPSSQSSYPLSYRYHPHPLLVYLLTDLALSQRLTSKPSHNQNSSGQKRTDASSLSRTL